MIERFNFYDIYGYLLPGGLLLGLLWLPFGLLMGKWPPADWGSAILALGLSYIVGHILHALSEAAFPSEFRDKAGKRRQPSDLLVDKEGEEALQPRYRLGNLKYRLAAQIERKFGSRINVEAPWTKDLKTCRSVAFFKCRSFLIEKKAAAYAEQQQGMYVLLRGAGAAFVYAFALYLGLGLGALAYSSSPISLTFGILLLPLGLAFIAAFCSAWPENERTAIRRAFAALISRLWRCRLNIRLHNLLLLVKQFIRCLVWPADERAARKRAFWFLAAALMCYGLKMARTMMSVRIKSYQTELMFTLAAIAVALVPLCLSAFKAFAANFAATIYRDFSVYAPSPTVDDIRARAYQIYEREGRPNGKADEHWKQAEEQLRG
jgi:hypothetical protein